MVADTPWVEELLKRPLYAFDLPQELLSTLATKGEEHSISLPDHVESSSEPLDVTAVDPAIATSTSCALCKVSFLNVQEQRVHVRSDHHRYNIKSQLRGNPTLDEVQFNKAIGELDESISGSESSEEEEEEGGDQLSTLLKKQAKISQDTEEAEERTDKKAAGKNPLFWFSSSVLPSNISLGIYRALFSTVEQDEPKHLVDSLRKKQVSPIHVQRPNGQPQGLPAASSPHIFMCMIGGGHFAAMLVSLAPEIHRKQGGIEERQARVIAHKTFHRYTTRRKQGGSQSASDAARGAAHSAGSSLRRYNEAALEKEIRELMRDWKQMIDDAQLLFIRATGNTNRKILFGQYEGQFLRQNDPRIRGFPFSTRRATQGELMRCFKELTRVKVSQIDEAALAAAEAKQRAEAAKPPTQRPQPQKPKLSKEDEETILHTSQIQALIRRSKIPAMMSYLSKNTIPPSFTFRPSDSPQNFRCPTLLHFAANLNSASVVLALLTKLGTDPTVTNGEGRTPFELAGDRATRDAFRIARHELGESKWDWDAAKVPTAVSKAEVDSRAQNERKTAEQEESNRRKAELDRLKKEEAARAASQLEARKAGGRTLGALEKTASEKREEEMRGMTPEMRMRLERERRARAAEERLRRMQGNQ
ncbi:putative C2H2 finger and ankyrin domain protein [Aspergillus clavatus NRRL 1]|uniref:C2H2 finger and ankyrin domain protein, putative n=1 Tax=Aspergillus clavatus (strain ATCC 1007 / CBS 513.65 / DSM 816 / NCTC 3887 / NRRL 1 / QM 1276 / 107) TaxID=344612 RepID=A1CAQ9_ASPCL|nr:C2H2 finger and ankyrin domain protein, putative [Aspergillus clavatus NRRL 1]EAW12827.1 C2H2 finger and ankyrin domain protein, putative [Aspergillus clavatus NRRL 1]